MGFWDKLKDASGDWAAQHAQKTDSMLDRIERQGAGRLTAEQQDKIERARDGADQMRDYAERRRQERDMRES